MLLAGTIYVRWPKVCAHYKLGDPKKVCGPRTMAYNQKRGEENCCFAHALWGPEHNVAQYKGKPFVIQEHVEELNKLKLTEVRDELKAEKNGNKKPPARHRRSTASTSTRRGLLRSRRGGRITTRRLRP